MLMAEKTKTRGLQLENERLKNTLDVYKKALKEKSEEIDLKNETINQMLEERRTAGEDLGLDDIEVDRLLDVNLGSDQIRDLLDDQSILNCDLFESPVCELGSSNSKAALESTPSRPGVVGRLKAQKMEKMGLPPLNRGAGDEKDVDTLSKTKNKGKMGALLKRKQGNSLQSSMPKREQHGARVGEEQHFRPDGVDTAAAASSEEKPSSANYCSSPRSSFGGNPSPLSSSDTSPTPPVKRLKSGITPNTYSASQSPTKEPSPQLNRLKIGVMSTRVGTVKNYTSNTSNLGRAGVSPPSDSKTENNDISAARAINSSNTVMCPHCPKQFPRGGAWKLPQHISSAHPYSSPHLAPQPSPSPAAHLDISSSPNDFSKKSSCADSSTMRQEVKPAILPTPPAKCSKCGEKLQFPSTQVAHRALHSASPPWQCLGCRLPLPSLHTFLDHVRGSHKVTNLMQAEHLLAPLEE